MRWPLPPTLITAVGSVGLVEQVERVALVVLVLLAVGCSFFFSVSKVFCYFFKVKISWDRGVMLLVIDIKCITAIDKIKFISVLFCVKCKVKRTHIFMTIGANRFPYGHIS